LYVSLNSFNIAKKIFKYKENRYHFKKKSF
jgi:hypothetical protein